MICSAFNREQSHIQKMGKFMGPCAEMTLDRSTLVAFLGWLVHMSNLGLRLLKSYLALGPATAGSETGPMTVPNPHISCGMDASLDTVAIIDGPECRHCSLPACHV